MKKSLILVLMAALLPSVALAQLKVDSNGKVGIGSVTTNNGALKIQKGESDQYAVWAIGTGDKCMLLTNNSDVTLSTLCHALKINHVSKTTSRNIGIELSSTNNQSGDSYGIRSYARNTSTGLSFAVCGYKDSSCSGAGVFGSSVLYDGSSVTGSYAGYFHGNVKVTGTIDGTLVNSSDARLKEDVQGLDTDTRGTSVLDALESLTPVSFHYKQLETTKNEPVVDENGEEITEEELPNPVMEKEHFGLIAQELQEVYPNLVYEKDDGYLAVNYVELVPVLMQAIKELKSEVDELKSSAGKASRSPRSENEQETLSLPFREETGIGSSMDQNVPNPFTEKTDIAIYLPESVQSATLYIYDLSGKQLEQHPITGRGNTVMTIHADRMDAGMYVYSLIADKKVVTTKKMIVVKK